MSRRITVCKDCVAPERHIGCHGTCEKYLKEKDEDRKKMAKWRMEHMQVTGSVNSHRVKLGKIKNYGGKHG